MKKVVILLSAFCIANLALASDWAIKPLIGLKAQYGGDTLFTIVYTDSTTQDINAGQGIDFYAGALAVSHPMSVKATIGYKYSTSMAENIDIAKTALPVNVTGRYNLSSGLFVGGGLTQHLNPQIRIDEAVAEFDPKLGYHVEAGWKAISIGWTSMTYLSGSTEIDASSFDVNLELVF